MNGAIAGSWTRLGLLALPLYGLLTFGATLTHQPNPTVDFTAYAAYLSTTRFLVGHVVGSIGGTVLALLGVIALAAYLTRYRGSSLVMIALIASIAGNALILPLFGVAAFASPAIGKAYLAGMTDVVGVNEAIYGVPLLMTGVIGGLCYGAGAILFGIAIWRSADLLRWAGIAYAAAGPLIALFGLVIGEAQTVGALLLVAAGAAVAGTAWRQPAVPATGADDFGRSATGAA